MPRSMLFMLALPFFFGACTKNQVSSKPVATAEAPKEKCRMTPPWGTIQIPKRGFVSIDPVGDGECNDSLAGKWERYAGKSYDLMLVLDGPGGSGRYWHNTVGVADKKETAPARGICFEESTIGWKSLRGFENRALPWAEDLNRDGDPELIIWDSFFLSDDEEMSDPPYIGLMAWVYRTGNGEKFELDWEMSRKFAARIAVEYHKPLPDLDTFMKMIREKAALALETFAKEGCIPKVESRQ